MIHARLRRSPRAVGPSMAAPVEIRAASRSERRETSCYRLRCGGLSGSTPAAALRHGRPGFFEEIANENPVSLCRKEGRANYGSERASCSLELEAGVSTESPAPEEIQKRIRLSQDRRPRRDRPARRGRRGGQRPSDRDPRARRHRRRRPSPAPRASAEANGHAPGNGRFDEFDRGGNPPPARDDRAAVPSDGYRYDDRDRRRAALRDNPPPARRSGGNYDRGNNREGGGLSQRNWRESGGLPRSGNQLF